MPSRTNIIIASGYSAGALTLGKYAALCAIGSPFLTGGEPSAEDAVKAGLILAEGAQAACAPDFEERVGFAMAAEPSAQAAFAFTGAALAPFLRAIEGLGGGGARGACGGAAPGAASLGNAPAIMLRCAQDFGWTPREALDAPLGVLMLILREDMVREGKALSFAQMAEMDAVKAAMDAEKAQAAVAPSGAGEVSNG